MPYSSAIAWIVLGLMSLVRAEELPRLELDQPMSASIALDDAEMHTPRLDAEDPAALPTRGTRYRIRVDQSGPYTIDLRSHHFKPYLVLRDADGAVVAEDDYSYAGILPRLVVDLEAGVDYTLAAGARCSQVGPFTLTLSSGQPVRQAPRTQQREWIEEARAAVAAVESDPGPETAAMGTVLHRLATLLSYAGAVDEAVELFERAAEVRGAVLGEHILLAETLDVLAMYYLRQRKAEAAIEAMQRAIRIEDTALGADHEITAGNRRNLAQILVQLGRFDEAAAASTLVGAQLHEMAIDAYGKGQFAVAEKLAGLALDCARRMPQPDAPSAESLRTLGTIYFDQGRLDDARVAFEEALALGEKANGPDHPSTTYSLSNLASVLAELGSHEEAEERFARLIDVFTKTRGDDHEDTATACHNLGRVLFDSERFDEAVARFEQAREIREAKLGARHPLTAQTLDLLGRAHFGKGDLERAETLIGAGLEIRTETLGAGHPFTAFSHHYLAELLARSGRPSEARRHFEAALEVRKASLGIEHPESARTLRRLAELVADSGEPMEAWKLSRQAVASGKAQLGRVLWSLTEPERLLYAAEMRAHLELLLGLAAKEIGDDALRLAYEELLDWKGQVSRSLTASRERLVARTGAASELIEELESVQMRISASLFDQDEDTIEEREAELESLRRERARLEGRIALLAGRGTDDASVTLAELTQAMPSKSAVVDFFEQRVYRPSGAEEVGAGTWSEPRVFAWIVGMDRALVRLDLGPSAALQAVLREFLEELVASRGVAAVGDAAGPSANDRLRALLWEPLLPHVGAASNVFISPDSFLGTLPFEVLQEDNGKFLIESRAFVYLQDMTSLVRIATSEEPEGVAEDGRGGLLCIGAVNYRKSGALDWREALEDAASAGSASAGSASAGSASDASAATAEPDDGADEGEEESTGTRSFSEFWTRLPATGNEAEAVCDLHDEGFEDDETRLLLKGSDATEERIKYELPRHRVVHLATHGFFQPEGLPSMMEQVEDERGISFRMRDGHRRLTGMLPGLLSGIVLAGANRPKEDRDNGLLTAEELSWVDLDGVELIVLSACETGLGSPRGGEGMLGLRRTLRQAGAQTVIASLWAVKDESTSQLMQRFYLRRWLKGQSRQKALRGAQLDLLKQNRLEQDGQALPSTWGAFVLDGDWR